MNDDQNPIFNDPEQEALIKALREGHMPNQEMIWDRNLTQLEFYYLLSRYPYLELYNRDKPQPAIQTVPGFKKSKSGWLIYDYGDVICSAGTELPIKEIRRLYKTLLKETPSSAELVKDDEEGEGGGRGTLQGQTIQTAYEMVQIAYSRWQQVGIIDGFYGMKRAAWVAAKRFGKNLEGFSPTAEDKVVLYWANKLTPNAGMEFKPQAIVPKR
ncbi:MAG: hypothetical protein K0R12_1239 [Gammaproteobacteria bacterium]|jgi:hypothetical protein|nr:hypothetical protein [Gammaproteobacteria bacterium]